MGRLRAVLFATLLTLAHVRCVGAAGLGVLLGVAANAWAQEPAHLVATATSTIDPTTTLIVELLRGGGLPAVLGLIAWLMVRAGPPTIRVIHVHDERALEERIRALEGRRPEVP